MKSHSYHHKIKLQKNGGIFMDKILVINCGSSSLKFKLFDDLGEKVIAQGLVERISQAESPIKIKYADQVAKFTEKVPNHTVALQFIFDQLMTLGIIASLDEIKAVGHRVVAGGEYFDRSVIVTEDVINKIDEISELAPLHNPANLTGIKICKKLLPHAMGVAAFDTSFHHTVPEKNFMYSVPYEWYSKYHVRRYGAHGISHQYIAQQTAKQMGKPLEELTMISCHLGAGSSVCAIKNGKSYDISMGFTPISGVQMATRAGDVDVSLVSYIMKKLHIKSIDEMIYILNKESGFKGVSGVSADMRDVEKAAAEGNQRAALAISLYENSVIRYIGQYIAELQGIDAITFTAGIGENAVEVRENILNHFNYLGMKVDSERNNVHGKAQLISSDDSTIKAFVIPTDEERMIASDVRRLLKKLE